MLEEICRKLIKWQHKLVRAQEPDPNHTRLSKEAIDWLHEEHEEIHPGLVVDVGCGQGFSRATWEAHGWTWIGVTLGEDYEIVSSQGSPVIQCDMHKLNLRADLVYARHTIEHSPFPAIALQNWSEVAPYLFVITPAPSEDAYKGHGHISVMPAGAWLSLFRFLDFEVLWRETVLYNNPVPWPQEGSEYRFLLRRKKEPVVWEWQEATMSVSGYYPVFEVAR